MKGWLDVQAVEADRPPSRIRTVSASWRALGPERRHPVTEKL